MTAIITTFRILSLAKFLTVKLEEDIKSENFGNVVSLESLTGKGREDAALQQRHTTRLAGNACPTALGETEEADVGQWR